ncbi:GAF domain-containing protein [Sphingomonas sp. MAH-6]|nr:GAF domain-containing protein [Sphingomonas chungangi]MVW55922.1 GAF domain-containing protein [Sphingomonas chungangi]
MVDSTRVHKSDVADPRLLALQSYGILDTPPEKAFDDIVEAASAFCAVPIALVSLVDSERQWFKACLGLNVSETPVDQAVCAIAIRQAEPLVIPDLALDPRTAANPLVTNDPRIRFYAGAQLVTRDGHALGTLCVIDTVPRPEGLTDAQLRGLVSLARQVTHLIEMRQAVEERDASIVTYLRLGDEASARALESEEARNLAEERDERSTAAQEAGRIGTFELDVATDIAVVSPQFCRIFGLPVSPTYSFEEIEANMVADETPGHSVRRNRSDGSAAPDVEYRIRRASDGQIRWIARRASFVRENGRVVKMFGTVHDVTERRQDAQRVSALLELGDRLRDAENIADTIALASAILGREIDADRVGYATIDQAAGTFAIARDWTAPGVPSLVGTHALAGFAHTLARLASDVTMSIANVPAADWLGDDRNSYASFGAKALINVPLVVREDLKGVLFVHAGQSRAWTSGEIGFAHGVADRTYATIAQLEAEEQRNVLNLELSHRMKNMLAMVQAIAAQTLKGVDDRDAVEALDQRLMALSSAHDVLLQDHWSAAWVGGVVERVLTAIGVADRIRAQGPAVSFGPRAALALSLLLHELSTNAVKYGSLSVEGGLVALDWRVDGVGTDAMFRMDWREVGGPGATEPSRKGFGSRLIRMGLLGTGGTTTRYLPSGFEAHFSVPLDRANAE